MLAAAALGGVQPDEVAELTKAVQEGAVESFKNNPTLLIDVIGDCFFKKRWSPFGNENVPVHG